MLTRQLAEWVGEVRFGDLPRPALDGARRSILDTLGVALAGSREEASRVAREALAGDGAGPAGVWGTSLRVPAEAAALLNGVSAHALDFDDVSPASTSHPSAVVLPACVACAETAGSSGAELLAAYAAGVELMAKLGRAMGEAYYRRGWHATSVLGPPAAAAAAAKLLAGDAEVILHALGIAASTASGLRRNFGSMTKPLHAGHAARSAVTAARLAAAGFTADDQALEGPLGFFEVFGAGATVAGLGSPWELEDPGLALKRYPCCYATHRALDAVLQLRDSNPELALPVSAVVVEVPAGALAPLRPGLPSSGLEGKFSMAYLVAVALLLGSVPLNAFTDEAVADPGVRALAGRVEVREDPALGGGLGGAEGRGVRVAVRGPSGEVVSTEVELASGSPGRQLTFEEVTAKFRGCADVGDVEGVATLPDLVLTLERVPNVAEVLGPLVGLGATPRAAARA
jgi:2-methylcitrate dehydratase PrpD